MKNFGNLIKGFLMAVMAAVPLVSDGQKSPVVYFPFDDNTSFGKNQPSENTASRTLGFNKYVNDMVYEFGGVAKPSHVRVPNKSNLVFGANCTISIYAKLNSLNGMNAGVSGNSNNAWHCLFAKDSDQGGLYAVIATKDSKKNYDVVFGNGNQKIEVSVNGDPTAFHFYSFVVTYNKLAVYVDGKLAGSKTLYTTLSEANEKDLYIGSFAGKKYPLCGLLEDFMIFDYALTDAEIGIISDFNYYVNLNKNQSSSQAQNVTSTNSSSAVNSSYVSSSGTPIHKSNSFNNILNWSDKNVTDNDTK